jgi:hypothetical protein
MHPSSHSTLTVALAVGFGAALVASLTPNPAVGYPTTAVATGTNPVVSAGGEIDYLSTSTVFEAYDERLIITDVVLTMYGNYSSTSSCLNRVTIDSGGRELARFHLVSDTYHNADYLQPTQVSHTYSSGLPVEPGAIIGITNHDSHCKVAYSLSGYLAQP